VLRRALNDLEVLSARSVLLGSGLRSVNLAYVKEEIIVLCLAGGWSARVVPKLAFRSWPVDHQVEPKEADAWSPNSPTKSGWN
jgi:hypothetical protein